MAGMRARRFPRCGARARTRGGRPCEAPPVLDPWTRRPRNGRCKLHGGRSTGPRTAEGRRRIAEAQRKRWRPANTLLQAVIVTVIIFTAVVACAVRKYDPLLVEAVGSGIMTRGGADTAAVAMAVTEQVPPRVSVSLEPRRSILDYPGLPLLQEPAQIERSYGIPLKREPNCKVAGVNRAGACLLYEFAGQEGSTSRKMLVLDGRVMAVADAAMPHGAASWQFPIRDCARITEMALASILSSYGMPDRGFPLRRAGMNDQQGKLALIVNDATFSFADGSAIFFSQIISAQDRECSVFTIYYAPGTDLSF